MMKKLRGTGLGAGEVKKRGWVQELVSVRP